MRPVVQPEEDAQQAQTDPQPQPAHGRVPAVPQEVHQERLPQSAHGERPRGNGELEAAAVPRASCTHCTPRPKSRPGVLFTAQPTIIKFLNRFRPDDIVVTGETAPVSEIA